MFDYDWFHGERFQEQQEEARWACTLRRFPDTTREAAADDATFRQFWEGLKTRILIYLRDGFSYELKNLVEVSTKGHLTFECEPVDEHYKVGAFVVAVPFEDVSRVEVFAVPPEEMPVDLPAITGFRSKIETPNPGPA